MGTPEFAVPSLKNLVDNQFNIVGVITAPDKPKGRGKQLGMSPVKEYAQSAGLNILQPTNLKDPAFLEELKSLKADLQVIVAFRMLPEVVWSMPPMGSFNLHASLLPLYRGAAPINRAIINGEKETGITTFILKHEIDTGGILFQEKEPIRDDDDVGSLYQRLMTKGADLVVKTVQAISQGDYEVTPQKEPKIEKHAPKIFKEDCKIDWNQSAEVVRNFIRGLSPYPAAWTRIEGKMLKIYQSTILSRSSHQKPGELITDNKSYIHIQTGDRLLQIDELQLEGKKRMNTEDFLRGYSIKEMKVSS